MDHQALEVAAAAQEHQQESEAVGQHRKSPTTPKKRNRIGVPPPPDNTLHNTNTNLISVPHQDTPAADLPHMPAAQEHPIAQAALSPAPGSRLSSSMAQWALAPLHSSTPVSRITTTGPTATATHTTIRTRDRMNRCR